AQSLFWRVSWLRPLVLLTPPVGWFVVIYLAALVTLLITAFWTIDPFTTQIVQSWNLDNFRIIITDSTYWSIIGRTVGIATLGARRWQTLRDVVLPLAAPGVVAGSIFTFSLTLGDYITPILVGGASSTFIGNVVYANVGIANNIPFAAALSMVPLGIMAVYLFIAYRLGAFEAL